jgi:sterol desaturase/sphingolipid hydroxylase (fatty acid hydroxylase superfamily)
MSAALKFEPTLRLAAFLAIFAAMAVWEEFAPRRARTLARLKRWPSNLGVTVLNPILLRIVFPSGAVGLALVGAQRGWGLFNNLSVAPLVAATLSVVLLDFVIYLQHVMFHAVPALWRLHRMHHADLDLDVTSGGRFHPLEILISMVVKFAAIAALGTPAGAVLVFEVLLNVTSMFNHSNVWIPPRVERALRWFVVTPDMHRVHHSILVRETNSNFGFNLPWWDRLLGTYRPQPAAGHQGMTIGIEQFRRVEDLRLDRMLLQPLMSGAGAYPISDPRGDR